MLRNIFLKSIRDSRYTFLYVFLTYLFVCSLIMYVVSELPLNEIQIIFEKLQLPEPLMSFIGGEGGLNLTTVEGILNTDMFTVFAPLDDAFAAISAQTYYGLLREDNKDKLVNILGRHVFSKKLTSSEINNEIKLKALNGEEVTIKKVNGIVYINEAEVVTADIEVSNGIIHFINRVLQPLN